MCKAGEAARWYELSLLGAVVSLLSPRDGASLQLLLLMVGVTHLTLALPNSACSAMHYSRFRTVRLHHKGDTC